MYKQLNLRHQESYENSNDDSYLSTINRNTEHISEHCTKTFIDSQIGLAVMIFHVIVIHGKQVNKQIS